MFSEELKDPQPSDFSFSEAGMSIISVSQIDKYTYKLLTNKNPTNSGTLFLYFGGLKDYNGNKITNGSTTFLINLSIPVDATATRNGVSTGGYPSISVSWFYTMVAQPLPGNTLYRVKLTTGSTDCNAGSLVTPVTSDATVGVTALNSGTTYNFSMDTSVIISQGAQVILVCVDNDANNKHGTGVINIVRDDSAPNLLIATPIAGNYIAPQTMTFTCSDNADRIAYDFASNVFSGTDPLLTAVTDPAFNPTTGAITSGTLYDVNAKPVTPYGGDTTRTIYKYRCIDRAGNISAVASTGVYRINTTFPTVSISSLNLTGVNPPAAIIGISNNITPGYPSATLTWSTNQVGQSWEIRTGATDCGAGGTIVASGTGPTATPSPANTPVTTVLTPASPGLVVGFHQLRLCVTNGTDWGQGSFNLYRDDTPPAAPTVNVPAGSYGATQYLAFSCTDNANRIIYTESSSTPMGTPSDPGDPQFDTTGAVTFGSLHNTPIAVTTDSTATVGKKTLFKWRCIDIAGNVSTVSNATYTIDTLLPSVTVQSQDRVSVSTVAGAYNSMQITWSANRDVVGYSIRRSSTNCSDGTVLSSGTNLSSASILTGGTLVTSTINANAANFSGGDGDYTIHICTTNHSGGKGYTTASLKLDSVVPQIAAGSVNASLNSSDGINFTLTWSGATDNVGVAGYRIFRSLTSGTYSPTPDYIATTSPATIAMPDTQKYFLRIVPFDAAGNVPGTAPLYYSELATKPEIRLVVSGLSGSLTITDGVASLPVAANIVAPGNIWSTSLVSGQTYNFSITAQPAGQVCAIRERQFGTFSSDLTINVDCTSGQITGGTFQVDSSAPLNYHLYGGKTTVLATAATTGLPGFTPAGIAITTGGTVNLSVPSADRIYRLNTGTGSVTLIAGSGTQGTLDGNGAAAQFYNPSYMASDGSNLYVSQVGAVIQATNDGDAIRKVDPAGNVITLVSGAEALDPEGLTLSGNMLYWANRSSHQVKSYNLLTGAIAVVAGSGTASSTDGTGTGATFNQPMCVVALNGNLYVTEFTGHKIRVINISTKQVTTLAGTGVAGFLDGPAASARFQNPSGIATDGYDLYITDYGSPKVRRIRLDRTGGTSHLVTTLAGDGVAGTGATGTGGGARFLGPVTIATDGRQFFIGDEGDGKVRKLTDNGLVGYWPVSPGVSPRDYNSDGSVLYNGAVVGGSLGTTVDRFGTANMASTFNGSTQFVNAGLPTNSACNVTMALWYKPTSLATGQGLAYNGQSGSNGYGIFHDATYGLKMLLGGIEWIPAASGYMPTVGQWIHVAIRCRAGNWALYVNGKKFFEKAATATTPTTGFSIGRDTASAYANGALTDVRLYNRALGEGEIHALAQDATTAQVGNSISTAATGLLAHYEFDNSVTATPSGPVGVSLGATGPTQTGVHGDANGAMQTGGGDYLASAPGLPIANNPRTMCAWFYPQNIANNRVIVMHGQNATNQAFGIALLNLNQIQFFNWGGPNVVYSYTHKLRNWQHVCGTLTGSTVEMFLNGVSLGSSGAIGAINTQNNGNIYVGTATDLNSALRFDGYTDDVRIYNSVLSAAQIRQLATEVPAGLIARFDYDNDTANSGGFPVSISNSGATQTDDRYGTNSRAYKFNGTESMTVNAGPHMIRDATFAVWINPSVTPTGLTGLLDNWNGDGAAATATGGGLVFNGPTGLLVLARGNGAMNDCYANWMPPANAYRHVAATIRSGSPGNISVYVDGSLIASCNPANLQPNFNNGINFSVGKNLWPTGFNGNIDDVRIYGRALSAGEVRAMVQQPNKKIYVTAFTFNGNLGGVSGADTKCNNVGDGNKPSGGTWKAMLVNTNAAQVRRACNNNFCVTGGVSESVDWVLRPNVTYMLSNFSAPIFTANWLGVFDFVTPSNNQNGTTTFTNAINGTAGYTAWTGTTTSWVADIAQCGNWDNNVPGAYPDKGVYGDTTLTNQPNGATPGAIYAGWGDGQCNTMMHRLYCVEQ